jgi:nitrogen regulatory protein PII
MKEIKAIIQPFRLDAVLDALHGIDGAPGAVISESRGISVAPGHYERS